MRLASHTLQASALSLLASVSILTLSACGFDDRDVAGNGTGNTPTSHVPVFCMSQHSMQLINGLATSKYPSTVLLLADKGNYQYEACTGIFVGHNVLLTASHCLAADSSGNLVENGGISYVPGYNITNAAESWGSRIQAKKALINAQAKSLLSSKSSILLSQSVYDLGILIFADNTAPATSPVLARGAKEGEEVLVLGYGQTSSDPSDVSTQLARRYGYNTAIVTSPLPENIAMPAGLIAVKGRSTTDFTAADNCTVSHDSQTAYGDSGGPLLVGGQVAGITTNGIITPTSKTNLGFFVDLNSDATKALIKDASQAGAKFDTPTTNP